MKKIIMLMLTSQKINHAFEILTSRSDCCSDWRKFLLYVSGLFGVVPELAGSTMEAPVLGAAESACGGECSYIIVFRTD